MKILQKKVQQGQIQEAVAVQFVGADGDGGDGSLTAQLATLTQNLTAVGVGNITTDTGATPDAGTARAIKIII